MVLLNFWGTWCEPCQHEIPMLIDIQNKYSSKGFTLVGAATNDENATVDKFIHTSEFNVGGQELKMNYPVVMNNVRHRDEIRRDSRHADHLFDHARR